LLDVPVPLELLEVPVSAVPGLLVLELGLELGLLMLPVLELGVLELEPLMPLGDVSDVLGGAPMLDEPVVDDVLPDISVELVLLPGEELMLPVPGALVLPVVEEVDVSLVIGDVIVVDDVDGVVVVVVDGVVVVVVVVVEPDERP
jgi:hypothetical protein